MDMFNAPRIAKSDADMRHILIVDDVEGNRAILERRLERFGFQLTSVDSGEQALMFVAHTQPDLILLDYMMPNMNGIEVLQALRGNLRTRDIPVIMVTARTEGEAIVQALEAGADDYVTKPIDFEILRARIETQFSKRQNASDLRRANAVLDERVSLRAMALAELQDELENETARRLELEEVLRTIGKNDEAESDDEHNIVAATSAPASATPGIDQVKLQRAVAIADALMMGATNGTPPNLALLAELKMLLESLSS